MTTQAITLAVRKQRTTHVFDLPTGAPDISTGTDTLVPYRITLDYCQEPTAAIPQYTEATIRGYFRDSDGTVSRLSNTCEVWRNIPVQDRAAWVAELIAENLPAWWDE